MKELRKLENKYIDLSDSLCLNVKQSYGLQKDDYETKEAFEKARWQVDKQRKNAHDSIKLHTIYTQHIRLYNKIIQMKLSLLQSSETRVHTGEEISNPL